VISGTGGLPKIGAGTHTYSGDTTLAAGALSLPTTMRSGLVP
jgi:hypothetical protein